MKGNDINNDIPYIHVAIHATKNFDIRLRPRINKL